MADDKSGTLAGQKLGTYQLTEKIGEGGMGAVYKARDLSLERTVAVKVLPAAMAADKTHVQRFVREARAIARLSHRNLVHIYHVGQREGLYYFAMEFIPGRTLRQQLAVGGPLTVEEFLRVSGQVLSALARIHSVGVTHRDVKSSNVIIEKDTGRAVLTDFGLAKETGSEPGGPEGLTSAGVVLGTPEYMSPEQANGQPADARSDLYAFGIMAYEMLTGKVPFRAPSAIAVLRKHIEEAVPPLEAARPGLPAGLQAIISRTLAKKPDERYQSASELAADLVAVGHTAELAELAAAGLPATAKTIVGAPLSPADRSGAQNVSPTARTVPVEKPAEPVSTRRGLLIAGAVAAGLVLLLVLGILAVRGCHKSRKPGSEDNNTVVTPPPPPAKPERGELVDIILPDRTRHRVRLLKWEGSLVTVIEPPSTAEKVVEIPAGAIIERVPLEPAAPPTGNGNKSSGK